jgi:hypothetical protein
MTDVLRTRYGGFIVVFERMKSSRIHFHLLVDVGEDIRTGFDFEAKARADNYQRMMWAGEDDREHLLARRQRNTAVYGASANAALRGNWAFLRVATKAYGFGRVELMPVRSSAEAVGKYVGKYISKHIEVRKLEDKGVRLVRYSGRTMKTSTRFGWNGPKAKAWRRIVGEIAECLGVDGVEEFREWFGQRWAYSVMRLIMSAEESGATVAEVARTLRGERQKTIGEA